MQTTIELNSRSFEVNYQCDIDGDDLEFNMKALHGKRKRVLNLSKMSPKNYLLIQEIIENEWMKLSKKERCDLWRN